MPDENETVAERIRRTGDLERIGTWGSVWATHYESGWTVFTRNAGIIAQGLSESEARTMIIARREI